MIKDYLQIGVITSSHGLRGELSVFPATDDPRRFEELKILLLSPYKVSDNRFDDTHLEKYDINAIRVNKNKVLISAKGITTRDASDKLKGMFVVVRREDAVMLDDDEFFIADIIGCKVFDKTRGELGVLSEVIETGSNDVYIVNGSAFGQILIPALKDVVLDIKPEDDMIIVALPKGLLDD